MTYLSGIQALVQLAVMQRLRDAANGLNTAGFVSGYRGSPLGGLDEALWRSARELELHHIRFQPGVNEELAATAVWGTQQLHLIGPAKYAGVFAMWYGKGPGVDRCGDVFKHMNHAGTARHGGALLVAGDDHGAYSSTLPHQSDPAFAAAMVPVLYPSNVQEYLDLGLHGWAMSRLSGCAVGLKALADTVESSTSVDADPFRVTITTPQGLRTPAEGLHARLSTDPLGVQARKQEALMQDYKLPAVLAYARANRLNRTVIDSARARFGIVASGKSLPDVLEALELLGIDEAAAGAAGIRVFKVAMPWPLEPDGIAEFARGLEEVVVVEEKQPIVERQLKDLLYAWRDESRPRVVGKDLLSGKEDLSVAQIARALGTRISRFHAAESIRARLAALDRKEAAMDQASLIPSRPAYYCSGCPHNSSTRVPEGSVALAGIGCHVMATSIYPEHNRTMAQMGGEGAAWIGQAPFSDVGHVFANLGDGTYFHSGHLAIRAAVAANVNVTYKILYNDAVAMTGGQPVDGRLSVPVLAAQLAAEGVGRIALVAEDVGGYRDRSSLPASVTVHHRDSLDSVQRELRKWRGVSVLIYDQTCAAEKRRRRKEGTFPQPARRVVINPAVCEGCGDCGAESNCTSVLPLETEFGTKRVIDQSSCNTDESCLKGFCPSFVTVEGARPRKRPAKQAHAELPPPTSRALSGTYNILLTGIGGSGVIMVGRLLGLAAQTEGRNASVLDMTGMSQKNGAVTSHVRIRATRSEEGPAARIPASEADLVLGCDLLTAAARDQVWRMNAARTIAVLNSAEVPPGSATRQPDWEFPSEAVRTLIDRSVAQSYYVDATRQSVELLGDAIASNLFMVGFAFQKGLIPLAEESILEAIRVNGVAVDLNREAFLLGRRAAVSARTQPIRIIPRETVERLVAFRCEFLTGYQEAAYAARYSNFVRAAQAAERPFDSDRLTRAVAHSLFKLMAYKDEYEVARLHTAPAWHDDLRSQFDGEPRLTFHFAPSWMPGRKRAFGAWIVPVLRVLASLKRLRGTRFDIFGYGSERVMERRLRDEYMSYLLALFPGLSHDNLDDLVALASLPQKIRGFGHVKAASVAVYEAKRAELLGRLLSQTSLRGLPGVKRPVREAALEKK